MAESEIVAWWGAGLSSLIGAVGLYDRFIRRPLPSTSYSLSGDEEVGNTILIINGSATPMLLSQWELFYGRPSWLALERTLDVAERDLEEATITAIPPHDWTALHFAEQNHFDWGGPMIPKGQLYLQLWLVGRRRPVTLHVYNPVHGSRGEPLSPRRLLPHFLRPRPRLSAALKTQYEAHAKSIFG